MTAYFLTNGTDHKAVNFTTPLFDGGARFLSEKYEICGKLLPRGRIREVNIFGCDKGGFWQNS